MVVKKNMNRKNKPIGQIFTPSYIAEFMVGNLLNHIEISNNTPLNLRILEPSVGEGIFLEYLLKYGFTNIIAYEMDYTLKDYLINSFPCVEFRFENFLGSDPKDKFDIIIGNPPYLGQNYNAEVFQDYLKNFPFCAKYFVGNMDLFYYFIHMGIEKLNPGGVLSFITTNYWITKSKKTGIKLIKPHLLEECFLLQYIDLSQVKVFEGAKGQHNCIFILKKKTKQEKLQKVNKNIEVIQISGNRKFNDNSEKLNKNIFKESSFKEDLVEKNKFISALSNNDLSKDKSWNLVYSEEVKAFVDKIENFCRINGENSYLTDYFIIRNGLILIKDSIFILKEGENLQINNNDYFILIDGEFIKLSELEKLRLKKIYKSKSIQPFGYEQKSHIGYVIYFNKKEFQSQTDHERNLKLKRKYPNLSRFIEQFEVELRHILRNANENPTNFYFPRRGSFIRQMEQKKKENLTDLEPLYDKSEKIFFKFISNENIFGYSNTSYYATSDTYFLWPKISSMDIDYLFLLAYLNSKLVYFLFKAKNLSIKRSKTKLEQSLPMPNLNYFKNDEKSSTLELIKTLTNTLVKNNGEKSIKSKDIAVKKILKSNFFKYHKNSKLREKVINVLSNKEKLDIRMIIDQLLFQLFDLNETEINKLLKNYYHS
jgi:adenine-specific DNA-methyltransferase